jgi:pimeloyl-ACP methyl ester carboxylesterase
MTDLNDFARISIADRGLCVLATARADATIQASVINAGVLDHPLTGARVVGLVARGGTRKLENFRRLPHATIVARSGWEWVAVEGEVDLIGPADPSASVDADALRLLRRPPHRRVHHAQARLFKPLMLGHFRSEIARDRYMSTYEDALLAWPTRPSGIDIDTRFGSTHVLATGATTGAPIVLIHAVAVSSPSWFANIAALGAQHPVYAIDTIGDVGRSTQTSRVRTSVDMALWLDDVLSGLDLGGSHLVGLSYGGWVALNQAARSPDRLASVTSVDPVGAIGRAKGSFLIRIAPDSVLASVGKSDKALHRLLRLLNNGATPEQPLLDLSVAGLRTFRGKQPFPRRMRDPDLRAIKTPTLLLFCERSPVNHALRAAQRSRRLVANATVEVIPDAGHMLPIERPDIFNSHVLNFIDGVDAEAAD